MINPYLQSDFPSNFDQLNQINGLHNGIYYGGGDSAIAAAMGVMAGAYMVLVALAIIALYIIAALSLMRISQKTKKGISWFAWIPILNSILLLNIAGLSGWYVLLMIFLACIPIIGWIALIIFMVYVWMRVAVACKKPDYLGLLSAVPPLSILLMLYFAYGDDIKLK